ncbi:hypothetical protein AQJ66_24330 [Streptomyces bungoensis]|uniref:Mutator family transposase n=1 Tax=Streptomyces bungoensis TaxID=285568 RepID=A0A101SVS9_9ACTN|nr:hypothetical protein AQJ66_24330 [Streptomyces bungoensis]
MARDRYQQPRSVTTATGAVEAMAPRANDKRVDETTGERERFSSAILPPWARKSPKISEVLPLPYLNGLPSGDFVPALEQLFGSSTSGCRGGGPGAAGRRDRALVAVAVIQWITARQAAAWGSTGPVPGAASLPGLS